MIDDLQVLSPDAARTARTLERCHRRLAPRAARRSLEHVAFVGFCVYYLASVATTVARVLIRQ